MPMPTWTRSLLLLPVALVALAGCHSTPPLVVDGFTLNPDPWLQDRQALMQRASFDISCDPAQMTLRVLAVGGNGMYFDDWATQVGVAGCNQKVVYVRTLQGWVANLAQSQQPAEQPPAAQSPAPAEQPAATQQPAPAEQPPQQR